MIGPSNSGRTNADKIMGNRTGGFAATVEQWVKDTEQALTAVTRQSIQDVINEAQTPNFKGGRLSFDTGFLRASGQSSLTGMPSGPARGELTAPNSYPSEEIYATTAQILVDLARMEVGATFYFGWTAEYALVREAYDGFLDGALQNWQHYITENARKAKKEFGI